MSFLRATLTGVLLAVLFIAAAVLDIARVNQKRGWCVNGNTIELWFRKTP